jgi:DNA-binding winged helix-turn-helix (wHTH) protein
VLSLRKKVEIDPRQPNLIQTVRNVGYRLNLEVLNAPAIYANGNTNGNGLRSQPPPMRQPVPSVPRR